MFNFWIMPFWIFYVVVLLVSFAGTWLVRSFAIRRSIMDIPNDRSSHTIPTPRGGGLAVAVAWFVGLIYFYFSGKMKTDFFLALLCGLPLTLIGFADDIFSLKPNVRFIVQFVCAGAALFFLKGLQLPEYGMGNAELGTFFPPSAFRLPLFSVLLNLLAFIAIVWSINLFNFLDGIDGYIGTEIIFIGLAVLLLTGDVTGLLLASATLGFLFWNWQKAKIFMGDVGSTLLGFTVAVMAIYHQNNHISSLPVWLILTSVFWFDATITLFRRMKNREKLSQAHRKHAYQRIVQAGFSHQKTVLCALVLNVVGLGCAWLAYRYSAISLVFLGVDLLVLYIALKWIDKKKPFEYEITKKVVRN